MTGTTQYPGALDAFPAIGPNTSEAAAGAEHDVVHENVHAAVLALQVKVGVDGDPGVASLDARVAAVESGKEAAGAVAAHDGDRGAHAEAVAAITVVAGVATMNCSLARFFTLALDANAVLDVVAPPLADCMILRVVPSAGAVLTLPAGATLLRGGSYVTGTAAHALGLMTLDGGASFDVVVAQP